MNIVQLGMTRVLVLSIVCVLILMVTYMYFGSDGDSHGERFVQLVE